MKDLTEKQQAILNFIEESIRSQGYPPTIREIGDTFSITAKGAYDHLKAIPSTYIFCNQDNCVPPDKQEAYLANLHIDKVIRIDSGHQPMNSRPGELADLLLAEAAQ